jgi:hypothetical protein
MGYRFSLVLSREITADESAVLRGAGRGTAVIAADTLPTDAEITVARMDFDDTVSASLAEAIESALDAVTRVPDLSVPSLSVPAQPAHAAAPGEAAEVTAGQPGEQPAGRKAAARKPAGKKAATRKARSKEG